ncbi:surface protease GP63, partial [Trypanosoma theileri]
SHWERRDAKDELMSVFIGDVSGMFYTTLTLSIFEDMKFYKANLSMAEPMSWGKNAGCSFLTDKCVKKGVTEYPNMFCTESKTALQCTSDRFALGKCTVRTFDQRLPERYRFFEKPKVGAPSSELMNHCPAIKPLASTSCEDGDSTQMPGSLLGPRSRCLKGESLELKEPSAENKPMGDICANVRCGENNTVMVQYKGDDNWYECPDGENIKPSEKSVFSKGMIVCPKYHEVCTGLPEITPDDAVENKETEKSEDGHESVGSAEQGEDSNDAGIFENSGDDEEEATSSSVVRELPTKGDELAEKYAIVTREGQDWQPIRIHVSAEAVDAAVEKCKDWAAKATEKNIRGDTFDPNYVELVYPEATEHCSEETLITADKKKTLVEKLLPAAIKLHSERLSVHPVQGNLVLHKTLFEGDAPCSFFKPPEGHHSTGVPGADFVLYVTTNKKSNESVKICAYGYGHRPIAAVKNFLPSEIGETRRLVRMAAHDIAHALGFDTRRMERIGMIYRPKRSSNSTMSSGGLIYFVRSPNTKEVVRKHYACENSTNGMRLDMESNTVPSSHWNRRIAKDELMSTYGDESSGMFYTALTLATFHDMKFYQANFSMAESMSWGKGGKCLVFRKYEEEKLKKSHSKILCKEEPNMLQCTSDRFGLGICARTNFSHAVHGDRISTPDDYPKETKWYKPYWPVVQTSPTTACEGGNEELMPGSRLGPQSRCLTTESLKVKNGTLSYKSVQGICANVKCDNDTVRVQYKDDETWHLCPQGQTIDVTGSAFSGGKIQCPKYSEVCSREPSSAGVTVFTPVDIKESTGTHGSSSAASTRSDKGKDLPKSFHGYMLPPEVEHLTEEERAMYREHFRANGGLDSSSTTTLMTSILALLCLAVAILVTP